MIAPDYSPSDEGTDFIVTTKQLAQQQALEERQAKEAQAQELSAALDAEFLRAKELPHEELAPHHSEPTDEQEENAHAIASDLHRRELQLTQRLS